MTSTAPVAARRRLRREAGSSTLEYVGLLAVAVLLVIALAVQAWPSEVGGMAARAICSVKAAVSGVAGRTAHCDSPATRTPYQQAVSGRYVAMGDSYSSGEGASDYEPGTDFDDRDDLWPFNDDKEKHNRCHRSADAYARDLSSSNAFAGGTTFVPVRAR